MGINEDNPWKSDLFENWIEEPPPDWRKMALTYQSVLEWVMRSQLETDELRKQVKNLNLTIDEMVVDIGEVASDRDTWRKVSFWLSEQLVAGKMAPETPTKDKVQKYLDGFYADIQRKEWEEDELS